MANHVYKDIAEYLGYCCEHALTQAFRGCPSTLVSKHLGIDDSAIRWWRRKLALGTRQPCAKCLDTTIPQAKFVIDWLRSRDE